jgi:hypothetical protein
LYILTLNDRVLNKWRGKWEGKGLRNCLMALWELASLKSVGKTGKLEIQAQ